MDVRIEAAPMAAHAGVVEAVVTTIVNNPVYKVALPVMAVASSSCPSMGSHSISAVAPDHNYILGGLAEAA